MRSSKRKKLFRNTTFAAVNQIVILVCGFIIPRQMLLTYGSETNGLVSSISQFLSFVSLLDMGMSTVVQAALYKPLAEKDTVRRDQILSAASRFFDIIAYILIVYTVILVFALPNFLKSDIGRTATGMLVLVISLSSVMEYLFGITNQVLLTADQKAYIHFGLRIATTVLNTIIMVVLMKMGCSIVFVKTMSALVFLIRPMGMKAYVNWKYRVNFHEKYFEDPIKQKWNGLAHHIAAFVFGNTDVVVLSLFAGLQDVSIYSVYLLIVSGINRMYSVCLTGVGALMGDLYARGEKKKLTEIFLVSEWLSHNLVVFLFSNTGIHLTGFVMLYTRNVNDANYNRPVFATLLTIAYGLCCLRNIYNILICSVGHFKQTQNAAIIEALLNIIVSLALVFKLGIVGVAIGTIVAIMYQQIYYYWYLHKNLINESYRVIAKQLFVDILAIGMILLLCLNCSSNYSSYVAFFAGVLKSSVLSMAILLGLNILFYKNNMVLFFNKIFKRG